MFKSIFMNLNVRVLSGVGISMGLTAILFSMALPAAPAENSTTKSLPVLSLNDLEGNPRSLAEWQGKVIMLNFWATWCGPCQTEIPAFIKYQAEYAEKGLQIIGVGLDEVGKLRNFASNVGINYPILQAEPERQYEILNQWGDPFGMLPFTVVIDQNGRLVLMQLGIFDDEAFSKKVKPLLNSTLNSNDQ